MTSGAAKALAEVVQIIENKPAQMLEALLLNHGIDSGNLTKEIDRQRAHWSTTFYAMTGRTLDRDDPAMDFAILMTIATALPVKALETAVTLVPAVEAATKILASLPGVVNGILEHCRFQDQVTTATHEAVAKGIRPALDECKREATAYLIWCMKWIPTILLVGVVGIWVLLGAKLAAEVLIGTVRPSVMTLNDGKKYEVLNPSDWTECKIPFADQSVHIRPCRIAR